MNMNDLDRNAPHKHVATVSLPKEETVGFRKTRNCKLFKSMLKGICFCTISDKRIIFCLVESARKIDGKEAARKTGYSNRPGSREMKGNQNR